MQLLIRPVYNFLKNNAYLITFIFCIICTIIMLYIKGMYILSYHPDISGSERGTTFGIQIVADKQPLYRNPEVPPFWIVQYAPIYYYLVGFSYRLLDWDPTNIHRIQFLSRLISFILISFSMVVAYATVRKFLNLSKILSVIFCCLIFGQLQQWHLTNSRIDSLLFLFTVLFIYVILKAIDEKEEWNKYFVLACFIAVVAFFTKQSALIHSVVLLGYFFYRFQWSSLLKCAGYLAVLFTIFTLIFSQLEFKIFYDNLFGSLELPIVPGWFYGYTFKHLIPATSILIAVSFVISFRWLFTSSNPRTIFLALATFLFFGFATATAFKHGAAVGYYHEFAYVGLIGIFYYFYNEHLSETNSSLTYYLFPALVGMTMLFFTSQQIEKYDASNLDKYYSDYIEQNNVKKYIEEHVALDDKVVISGGEDYRGWLLQHMLFKHLLAYQDTEVRFLFEAKRFNFNGFYGLVKEGKIKYLILDRNSPPYIYAFNYTFDLKDYSLEKDISGYKIYRLNK